MLNENNDNCGRVFETRVVNNKNGTTSKMSRLRDLAFNMLTGLKLMLWKNLIIRKRHWILTIVECLMPVVLFGLIAYGRSKIPAMSKINITETQTEDPMDLDTIYSHLPVGHLQLWYSPHTNYTEEIMNRVQLKFSVPGESVREFGTEEKLVRYFESHNNGTVYAVIFNVGDPKQLQYDIRIHHDDAYWYTTTLYPGQFQDPPPGAATYLDKGFLALQLALDTAFMEMSLKVEALSNVSFLMQAFPYPPHVEDTAFKMIFMHYLPIVTIFSFIFMCPAVLKRITEEKSSGIKELMKMAGLRPWMIWYGWYFHAIFVNLFAVACIVILMKVPLFGSVYPPIEFCDPSVLFIFLMFYTMACISLCFFIASLFSRPTLAMIIGLLLWIMSYFLPRTLVGPEKNVSWSFKTLLGIFPNMALHYGYEAISVYETTEVGVQWTNLFQSGSQGEGDVTMGNVFVMFGLQFLFYLILTVYLDNINPGEYGIAKPVYYPILWLKRMVGKILSKPPSQVDDAAVSLRDIEEGRNEQVCIEIMNLKKQFGACWAVDGLNLKVYDNRITVLLGHNGAGKTTTMSIITGMIPATRGEIKINGINVINNINDVKQKMGLCPQHNLLFPDLTVLEHVTFFAMLKGSSLAEATRQSLEMLDTLGLADKKNSMACSLSGGMKRKLCLAIALIGNSQILILDEPTAGMDPESRRKVWDMLLKMRRSRTILVTTHFMEEADYLGDWIAIMSHGKLMCHGTPMFLKKKYGTGYRLHMRMDPLIIGKDFDSSVRDITNLIQNVIPGVSLLSSDDENIIYLLPIDEKDKFSKIFKNIADKKDSLGIVDMGLTVTTLNDVFLNTRPQEDIQNPVNITALERTSSTTIRPGRHFNTLFTKRWLFFMKKWLMYLPACLILLLMLMLSVNLSNNTVSPSKEAYPKLNVELKNYGKTGVYFGSPNGIVNSNRILQDYKRLVEGQDGHPFLVTDVKQAIADKGIENIAYYKQHMVVGADFHVTTDGLMANALFNSIPLHAAPISLNLVTNAVAKYILGTDYSISTTNHPLRTVDSAYLTAEVSKSEVGFIWFIFVPFGLLFFVGNFIIFPNFEIPTNFYQLQTLCGVSSFWYWISNVFFDSLCCIVELLLVTFLLWIINICVGNDSFGLYEYGTLFIILLAYCVSAMPFVYLFSVKKTLPKGFNLLLLHGMFWGLVCTLIVGGLELSGHPDYETVGRWLRHIFLITCPPFSISFICVNFALKFVDNHNWLVMDTGKKKTKCQYYSNPCCQDSSSRECRDYESYFLNEEYGIGFLLVEMFGGFFLYFSILLLLDNYWVQEKLNKAVFHVCNLLKRFSKEVKSQVSNKNPNICNVSDCQHQLHAKKLTKRYLLREVVKNVSLNVPRGKCYGLLGVNGAGKTTTFKMLTKEIVNDSGEIEFRWNKEELRDSRYLENIGYCPQGDALNYALTGKELLRFQGLLRGYTNDDAEKIAINYLTIFGLLPYADLPCITYSGGNKRKLSTCLAFVALSHLILLDEPSNGMDPTSKQTFWNVLSSVKKLNKNTSFVLCSHSMEECEALCDVIGIMKGGEIECEGTLFKLKEKYQKGFLLTFKLSPQQDNSASRENVSVDVIDGPEDNRSPVERILDDLKKKFQDVEVKDEHSTLLHCLVKTDSQNFAELFEAVAKLQTNHPKIIEDYTVSQASLEDIFLSIANSSD